MPSALGNGYGHIAFAVDDLDAEHARFADLGFVPRKIVAFERGSALFTRFCRTAGARGARRRLS